MLLWNSQLLLGSIAVKADFLVISPFNTVMGIGSKEDYPMDSSLAFCLDKLNFRLMEELTFMTIEICA